MKRIYIEPVICIVPLMGKTILMESSHVESMGNVNGNSNMNYGGSGSGESRVKSYNLWDDDRSD